MANTNSISFPSHAETSVVKETEGFGTKVGQAIEGEWFSKVNNEVRYFQQRKNFHNLRLYAAGNQPVGKYKKEFAINGDTSYLNLDWTPVPIIPKFVDIVVNGIAERPYSINCYAQDPSSIKKRTDYIESMLSDMNNKELFGTINDELGLDMFQNNPETLPMDEDELALHMQLDYKESIEVAQEEAISNIFDLNKFELTKTKFDYDLVILGIGCVKHSFNTAEGIIIDYVDPENIVHSYTEDTHYGDLYYVAEVKRISIPELKKTNPHLTDDDIRIIEKRYTSGNVGFLAGDTDRSTEEGFIYVMYYEYKTYNSEIHKIKETASGAKKAIRKDESFNPPKTKDANFEKVGRSIEVLYSGSKIVGCDYLLSWGMNENMTKPKSDTSRCQMSYNIVAPKMYKGEYYGLVSRMIPFADPIQRVHMKLQQVTARLVPDGVYLDADGLSEIDLGEGTSYNPQEALNMYFQTGSVIGRSMTSDGEYNHGKIPIQELTTSSSGSKIQTLIGSYNHNLQMIRDVTGLNEARDGSSPDSDALVGIQKLAAANSNTATRHIVQAGLYLTLMTAEGVTLRISDVLEYSNTRDQFLATLGRFNVATLDEIKNLYLHDMGMFIELDPDMEEKAMLENNIQIALAQKTIDLDDAIDIRGIKNLTYANQTIKVRKRKKHEQDRKETMENMQMQTQSNAQSAQAAAMADVQKNQAIAETTMQLDNNKALLNERFLEKEVAAKKELMQYEADINFRLKDMELNVINRKEGDKEDRKDQRTKIQASQQSKMIEQRQNNEPAKDFESTGNDVLDGGVNLTQFEPK